MASCQIITVANQKGGTGKTTTSYNLGVALAEMGKRVLLVDNDPQSNLSTLFGIETLKKQPLTLHDIITMLLDEQALPDKNQYIVNSGKLDIIPASINLSVTEINLRNELGGERTLSTLLEPLQADYEIIIIDTNPYLGLLTINALAACDRVIIPVSPQLWSANGLTSLLDVILKVKKKLNPKISVAGILMTMTCENTVLHREATELVKGYFKGKVNIFETQIPMTVKVGQANFYSQSILQFDAKNKAALAYAALAREVSLHG